MVARLPLRPGSSDARGDEVTHWQKWAKKYAPAYGDLMGPVDGYYGNSDAAFTREMQRRLGLPQTGWFDAQTAARVGYKGRSDGPAPATRVLDTHYLSSPGSGADYWVGPSHTVGEWLKNDFGVQHWPLGYPKGGYLGLMGGDPTFSYLDVIGFEDKEFERRIRVDILAKYLGYVPAGRITAEQVAKLPRLFRLLASGYSQSADGILRAILRLFGDGGDFELLRPFLKGVLTFGNPARQAGVLKNGRNPKGSGIAGIVLPPWLAALVYDVITEGPTGPDFYACCTNAIAREAYQVVVQAETSVPFLVYCVKIAVPAIVNIAAPFLAGLPFGQLLGNFLVPGILATQAQMPLGQVTNLLGAAGGQYTNVEPPPALIQRLSIAGLLQSLPELIGLLIALPGIQTHGEYHLPKPEFGGYTGEQEGHRLMRSLV